MRIYLSSTYQDLKLHRARLAKALRKAQYEVVMMEEYVARDARVEFACAGDVVACDVYVGLFAWRHGYVPAEGNAERRSVTEMEYEAAGAKPMPRLTFLLDDAARWPDERKDADLAPVQALRARLKQQCSAYFRNADELAVEVLAALRVQEATKLADRLAAVQEIVLAQALGPSGMVNIRDQLPALAGTPFIELQLGPTPWWNTRLYLVAALAQAGQRALGLVFLDEEGRFVKACAPAEVCRRLAQRWPALATAYGAFRAETPAFDDVGQQLWRYPMHVAAAFGRDETQAQHTLTVADVADELGLSACAEIVDVENKSARFLQREILGRRSPWVALLRGDRLQGLVDRPRLAEQVARTVLAQA